VEPETAPTPSEEFAPVSRQPSFLVLQGGAFTSVLALLGIYWLNKNTTDFHIMGWYANYVIPVGAILVGVVAGSGYGLASWFTGVRISRRLLLAVLVLQTGAYLAAEFVEYRDVRKQLVQRGIVLQKTGKPPTFLQYYDLKARTFAWKKDNGKGAGKPLGGWGYVFVLLGAAGFVLSGLIAPAVLFAVPYCDSCQRYMTSKVLGVLPASVPAKKIAKNDKAAQEEHAREQTEAAARADEVIARLREAITAGNVDVVKQELAAAGSMKTNNKLRQRVEISLTWCKGCEGGRITPTVISGSGEKTMRVALEPAAVTPEFVRGILAG
jgi:hypothetical protein